VGAQRPFGEAKHIERRCSEANRRRCPPDESRNEGTPSFSERAGRRSKPFFAYFFEAFVKKVSRRKGETLGGLDRSNGYAHRSKSVSRSRSTPSPQPYPPGGRGGKGADLHAVQKSRSVLEKRSHFLRGGSQMLLMRKPGNLERLQIMIPRSQPKHLNTRR